MVDTNVPIAANGRDTHADLTCQLACLEILKELRAQGQIVLDMAGRILAEYRGYLRPVGQPGVGDVFYKHILNNQYNAKYCVLVDLPVDPVSGQYLNFPNDPALAGFDPSDRKFVAAALACADRPPVVNALDTDWRDYAAPLAANGVVIEQLCPQHMRDR